MFTLIEKGPSVIHIAIILLLAPCEASRGKAVDLHRHELLSTSITTRGDPGPPPGSPAYIRANPPPPMCSADSKVNVFVGKDNVRTFTTVSGYFSDEASRNKVRCKGSLPSEKCLAFDLRTKKSDAEVSPPLGLLAHRKNGKTGSLRSTLIDAVEGPLPTESSISRFGTTTELTVQAPNPETKPADMKGFKPGLSVSPGVPQNSPVHPAAKTIKEAENPPAQNAKDKEAPKQQVPQQGGGAINPIAAAGTGGVVQSHDFTSHSSTECSSVSAKECPCVQDNEGGPLLWAPNQYIVSKVEEVSLAVPDQKNRDLKKEPLHILVLGVGSGALSMSVLNNCRVFVPGGLKVESVEPDQSVATVAQQLFGFKSISGVHKVEVTSCGHALEERVKDGNAANGGKYDVVVINVFNGDDSVPTECRNATFLGNIKSVVKDQGVVLQSIHSKELKAAMGDYTSVFGYKVRTDQVKESEEKNSGAYHVIVAGDLDLVKSGAALPHWIGFTVVLLAALVAF